jgi:hypothetical protein
MCIKELNLEKLIVTQHDLILNTKTVAHNVTQLQLPVTFLFEIKILSFTHR